MLHIIIVKNPFDRRQREDFYEEYTGTPLKDMKTVEWPHTYAINGNMAKEGDIPQDGDEIVIMPVIGKKAFGWILTIGISVLSAGVASGAAWAFGAATWSVWAKVGASLALTMLGNYVSNKLTPKVSVDRSNTEQSNTYGWGSMQSLTGQGQVLPVVYGTVKTAGMILQRHVVSDGKKQYLSLLYCLAEGPLDYIDTIKLNGNDIENFHDVDIGVRYGEADQDVLEGFANSYADTALAYTLDPKNGWYTVTLDGNTAQELDVSVSFPQGLYYSNDKGNPDWTSVTIEAQYRKAGTSTWNQIPIRNENYDKLPDWAEGKDDSRLASTWQEHYYADCRTITGYNTVYKSYWHHGHNRKKKYSEPIYSYSMSYDEWKQKVMESGLYSGIIRQKETAAFYRCWAIGDLEPGKYEVRMRCSAKDGTSIRHANKVQWDGVTQVIYGKFRYPGKALLGLKALATDQLSGADPQMTCEVTRENVYVWNPTTKKYEAKPANNPAWACYDILHHCLKYGDIYDVQGVPKECMDYYSFEAWANRCDEEDIEFNYLYDSAMQIQEALTYPCRVGKGSVLMMGTKYSCIYDFAASPSQLFTVANIKKGSFKEEFQATDSRANAIEISFMNEDKNYERDVLTVYSDTYDASDTLTQPTQVELMGCTNADQAYRYGKYKLRSNKYEIRTISFEAWTDAIACSIGDVILVQHDSTEWGIGGRVQAVDDKTITLDRDIPPNSTSIMVRDQETGKIYTTRISSIRGRDIAVESAQGFSKDAVYAAGRTGQEAKQFKVISIEKNMAEETREITAVEYYPELYSTDLDKVPNIPAPPKENSGTGRRLMAVRRLASAVVPAMADEVDGADANSDESGVGSYEDEVEGPRNLLINTERRKNEDGQTITLVHLSWIPPRESRYVHLEVSNDGINWRTEKIFHMGETGYTIQDLSGMQYYVRLYATDDRGKKSAVISDSIQNLSGSLYPPDVIAINAEKMASGLRRYWWEFNYPSPNNIAGFRVKYTQGSDLNWDNGIEAQKGLITRQPFETQTIRQGMHAVMIKAVDYAGNESRNIAYCMIDLGDTLAQNVISLKDFKENGWNGVSHTGEVMHDGLIHAKVTNTMWTSNNQFMWSRDETQEMWQDSYLPYDLTGTWAPKVSGQLWFKAAISGPAAVYYRKILTEPFWARDGPTSMWSRNEDETIWGPGTMERIWKQYSDRVLIGKDDIIQVRIHAINSSYAETVISGLTAYIDVPDRNEHFEGLPISKAGTELPIVTPHYKTTAVHLDAIQGKAVSFKFVTRTPCVIQLLDSEGNPMDAMADISWQGYEEDK